VHRALAGEGHGTLQSGGPQVGRDLDRAAQMLIYGNQEKWASIPSSHGATGKT
jgi:hypothetical protein